MQISLTPFFEPKNVAIIGASKNPTKLSNGIVKNMLSNGFDGRIFPINPKDEEILGIKCFPSITLIEEQVDLAVIILPANAILDVVRECGEKGVKAVIVISGGFKEIGDAGLEMEKDVIALIQKYHMRMIGPNCVGTMNLRTGLNTTFIRGIPSTGGIGFISQSGAMCGGVVDHVVKLGVGFSHLLSLGNEADVSETDMIEYLADDKDTTVIAAYLEGIQDGQRFIQVGRKVTRSKPIVILKAGRSTAGAQAVSSHTGSLAGSYDAYQAAFKQGGYFEVHSTRDLLNCAMALDWLKAPKGNRAVIVTNSGGPAALASDSFSDHGILLAELKADTKTFLAEKLNSSAQVANPVDMLGGAAEAEYAHAMEIALADENVDMALAVLVPQSLVDPVKIAQAIIEAAEQSGKPVIACLMGHESVRQARDILHAARIPMIDFPVQAGVMFHALIAHRDNMACEAESGQDLMQAGRSKVADLLSVGSKTKFWGEHFTRDILHAYGLPNVQGRLVKTIPEAVKWARELGYPVVMKGASNDILHKSDACAVAVNIKDDEQLERSFHAIKENMFRVNSQAVIDGLLIEKMAPDGKEIIIGMKRDPSFGPMIMFGLGGIFVELFKDVAFRIAPLTRKDIHHMITSTKAYQLLKGWRGEPVYDIEAIEDAMMKLSQLVVENPSISEIEINPLRVFPQGDGALVLDCRMIMV